MIQAIVLKASPDEIYRFIFIMKMSSIADFVFMQQWLKGFKSIDDAIYTGLVKDLARLRPSLFPYDLIREVRDFNEQEYGDMQEMDEYDLYNLVEGHPLIVLRHPEIWAAKPYSEWLLEISPEASKALVKYTEVLYMWELYHDIQKPLEIGNRHEDLVVINKLNGHKADIAEYADLLTSWARDMGADKTYTPEEFWADPRGCIDNEVDRYMLPAKNKAATVIQSHFRRWRTMLKYRYDPSNPLGRYVALKTGGFL